MIWRSTALLLIAFVAAYLAVWFSPMLLAALGLGEFSFVGQFGLPILVLSVLDVGFRRLGVNHDRGE